MEYTLYILAVLVMGLICSLTIRYHLRENEQSSAARLRKRNSRRKVKALSAGSHQERYLTKAAMAEIDAADIVKREVQNVRTPWGWARHQELNNTFSVKPDRSKRVWSLTQKLVKEKELAGDRQSNPHTKQCVRALLEDRFGRTNQKLYEEVKYNKVKAPLLRDPREQRDQMDNFDSREADRVRTKLRRMAAMNRDLELRGSKNSDMRYVSIKDIKQPWGW